VGASWRLIPSLAKVLQDIEMPLVPVLARIERQGALVDANLLGLQSIELGNKMVALERQAFEIAGEEFNLASPKQLGVRFSTRNSAAGHEAKPARVRLPPPRKCWPSWLKMTFRTAQGVDAVPQHEQAEKHLYRPFAGADQPAHRAHPHQLSPGRGRNRAFVVQRSEPAEHSDPHG
jgi:hypothetical protein